MTEAKHFLNRLIERIKNAIQERQQKVPDRGAIDEATEEAMEEATSVTNVGHGKATTEAIRKPQM